MIGNWTSKLYYYVVVILRWFLKDSGNEMQFPNMGRYHIVLGVTVCMMLVISTLVCLNILHTDANIQNFLREAGMIPTIPMKEMTETATNVPEMSRIFYSAIGDLVETVPVFPITFNVPDIISSFGNLLTGMLNFITGDTSHKDGSEPKDIMLTLFDIYKQLAVQEDLHDFEFMT